MNSLEHLYESGMSPAAYLIIGGLTGETVNEILERYKRYEKSNLMTSVYLADYFREKLDLKLHYSIGEELYYAFLVLGKTGKGLEDEIDNYEIIRLLSMSKGTPLHATSKVVGEKPDK